MSRRTRWIVALVALVVGAVSTLALAAARRDRAELLAAFGEEHLARLRSGVAEVEAAVEDVVQDLQFAAQLVAAADSRSDERRELEALLAVVRGYRAVAVYEPSGAERLVVLDPRAPAGWTPAPYAPRLAEAARAALARGTLAVSAPGERATWLRAFAAPLPGGRGAVAVLVDLEGTFERLQRLAGDASTRLLVIGPHGRPAPLSDPALAGLAQEARGEAGWAELLRRMRAAERGTLRLGAAEAASLGLGDAEVVAAFAPIAARGAGHWAVASLSSTRALRAQERSIALRMGTLAAAFAAAVGGLAAYLVAAARREIEVRERLRSAEQLAHLNEQLLRAEKLATVGVLAAGIAHEIGTPLGVVRGRAELLGVRLGEGHPQAAHARIIVSEIDRISRVIRELLDFSRAAPATGGSTSLDAVARDTAELLGFEARSRRVALEVDVPADVALAGAPDPLKQVLVNLTLNALDACRPGGRVALRGGVDAAGGAGWIEVVDDGAGIPDELRHRVFDPFFTTKKRGKGTGLGLTVAARIVRDHGGEIELESGEGRGTRVRVRWPAAAPAEGSSRC